MSSYLHLMDSWYKGGMGLNISQFVQNKNSLIEAYTMLVDLLAFWCFRITQD